VEKLTISFWGRSLLYRYLHQSWTRGEVCKYWHRQTVYDHQNRYRLGEKGTTGEQKGSGDKLHSHRGKKTWSKF